MSKDIIPRTKIDEKIKAIKYMGDKYRPLIILEGKSDFKIYSKLFKLMRYKKNQYEIVVADGKSKIKSLKDNGKLDNIEYIAILDSDFDLYNGEKIEDDRVIYTHFYDIENYITVSEILQNIIVNFEDCEDDEINCDDIVQKALEILYPYMVAVKYKLNYMDQYNDKKNIYKIEDESILNKKLSVDGNWDIDKLKSYIISDLESKGKEFDEQLWIDSKNEVDNEIIDEESAHKLVKGRRFLEIYHNMFSNIFKEEMEKRTRDIFIMDLRTHIGESSYCKSLLKEIEESLGYFIS